MTNQTISSSGKLRSLVIICNYDKLKSMNNALDIHREDLSSSQEVETEVLFVDLDETILQGTASRMSDEEIIQDGLIDETKNKMDHAKAVGIKVVMATRNNFQQIERVLALRPDLNSIFDDSLACESSKSSQINNYLTSKRIEAKNAVFIDDTEGELTDVEKNSNVISIKTGKTNALTLKKVA